MSVGCQCCSALLWVFCVLQHPRIARNRTAHNTKRLIVLVDGRITSLSYVYRKEQYMMRALGALPHPYRIFWMLIEIRTNAYLPSVRASDPYSRRLATTATTPSIHAVASCCCRGTTKARGSSKPTTSFHESLTWQPNGWRMFEGTNSRASVSFPPLNDRRDVR